MKIEDEAKILMNRALSELAPRWDEIKRTAEGGAAVVFVDPDPTSPRVRKLVDHFGDEPVGTLGSVHEAQLLGWEKPAPAGVRRILLVAGRGVFQLRWEAGRFSFEHAPGPDAIVKALHR